jgi:ribulose 1,5-bisphosphate synthetase/thiazole synthase
MKEIIEPSRVTPVVAETEVLVIGSGPGGLAAAISSARTGVETMIVERYGCFGGNLTHVGVEGIAWYRQPGTVDVEGIGIEFEERAKRFGSSAPEVLSPGSKSMFVTKAVLARWLGASMIVGNPRDERLLSDRAPDLDPSWS